MKSGNKRQTVKLQLSYVCDGEKGREYGIYVAEGITDERRRFPRRISGGRADTAIAVMCREAGGERGKTACRILERFEHWFRYEFPLNRQPFSPEVVRCYWSRIIGGRQEMEQSCRGLAVLLIDRRHLVFYGMGELAVYEYIPGEGKGRRWPIGRERHDLDRELGIPEEETADFTFLSRSISKDTLFLILPGQCSVKDPNQLVRKRQMRQLADELSRYVPCAVLCHVQRG